MKTTKTNAVARFVLNLFCNNCDKKIGYCSCCAKRFMEKDFVGCVGGVKYEEEGEVHLCLNCYKKENK